MYAFRDSSITMWQHHLIIEGQRKGKKGLIAGIKKDVVLSGKIPRDAKPDREAIYGCISSMAFLYNRCTAGISLVGRLQSWYTIGVPKIKVDGKEWTTLMFKRSCLSKITL